MEVLPRLGDKVGFADSCKHLLCSVESSSRWRLTRSSSNQASWRHLPRPSCSHVAQRKNKCQGLQTPRVVPSACRGSAWSLASFLFSSRVKPLAGSIWAQPRLFRAETWAICQRLRRTGVSSGHGVQQETSLVYEGSLTP